MAQRPPQRPTFQQPAAFVAGVALETSPAPAAALDSGMEELLRQFEEALHELENDPSMDLATRTMLRDEFTQAMRDMKHGSDTAVEIPDRAMWMDALQALQASGAVATDEVDELIRQVNQALQPLQRRDTRIALEFSRRLSTEGEEKALAWFRTETAKNKAEEGESVSAAAPPVATVSPILRGDVVNSRSRRLRGPP
jgi:hypothetical protein